MSEWFLFERPLLEIVLRGTAVYLIIAVVLRLSPKRNVGNVSPNDMIALIIIGTLVSDAIMGSAKTAPDIILMVLVVLFWDYLINIVEYYLPRLRCFAQDSPTLLIDDGVVQKDNLRKEKLTEEELSAHLRKQGISDAALVKQAILEVDGHISVIRKD